MRRSYGTQKKFVRFRRIEIRRYNIDRADGSFEAEKDVRKGQSFSEGIPLEKTCRKLC